MHSRRLQYLPPTAKEISKDNVDKGRTTDALRSVKGNAQHLQMFGTAPTIRGWRKMSGISFADLLIITYYT